MEKNHLKKPQKLDIKTSQRVHLKISRCSQMKILPLMEADFPDFLLPMAICLAVMLHLLRICLFHMPWDNNAIIDKLALPPSVTALFNSAVVGGSNACKWKPQKDCSVETLESSYFTDSALSSTNSFSTQDAEAQLSRVIPVVTKNQLHQVVLLHLQHYPLHKVKTVAEFEADMHQNSPQKTGIQYGKCPPGWSALSLSQLGLVFPSHSCHEKQRGANAATSKINTNANFGQQLINQQGLLSMSNQQMAQTLMHPPNLLAAQQACCNAAAAQQFQKQQLYLHQQQALQQAKQIGILQNHQRLAYLKPCLPHCPMLMSYEAKSPKWRSSELRSNI
ncbi:hypothetical protein Btru_030822 [Bulinus truncatus]|nr:hypothetical protein Btru_030822 [Bulinus truncatus]